jgi:hypothetical protein
MPGQGCNGDVGPNAREGFCNIFDGAEHKTINEVASYPEPIQRLLGWSAGANYTGWVEVDGQMIDPIHLLADLDRANLQGVGARRH